MRLNCCGKKTHFGIFNLKHATVRRLESNTCFVECPQAQKNINYGAQYAIFFALTEKLCDLLPQYFSASIHSFRYKTSLLSDVKQNILKILALQIIEQKLIKENKKLSMYIISPFHSPLHVPKHNVKSAYSRTYFTAVKNHSLHLLLLELYFHFFL